MSFCTTTVPNSVRNSAPVGHTSKQAACVQCLQTSDDISHRKSVRPSAEPFTPGGALPGIPKSTGSDDGAGGCSIKATCRHVSAPSAPVLSNDMPRRLSPSSGTWFHSLQATSQALHPMQMEVSVKKPTRSGCST